MKCHSLLIKHFFYSDQFNVSPLISVILCMMIIIEKQLDLIGKIICHAID